MNENRETYQYTDTQPAGNPSIFDMPVIQLLLAGMYFLLGVSRVDRIDFRERAIWHRKVKQAAELEDKLLDKKDRVLADWSGDDLPHWWGRMKRLTFNKNNNPHPEAVTSIDVTGTRRTRIMGNKVADPSRRPYGPPQGEGYFNGKVICRAPP